MEEYEDDLDDYYEDGGEEREEEGEYEEEEERQPTKEELKYLEMRQRLKDSIRRKMKKREGSSALANSQEKKSKPPYNDFGSFFGPSQPVISSRVIQESKSLLENEQLASRLLNSSQASKKPIASSSAPKNGAYRKQSRVVNEVKKKVEKLKDTRDYSFLFSDDTELPTSSKKPLSHRGPTPSSEARSAQLQAKPKQPSGISGRANHGIREEKRPFSANGQLRSQPPSLGGQVHSRLPSSGGLVHSRPASSAGQTHSRPASSGGQTHSKPTSLGGQMHLRPGSSMNGQTHSRVGSNGQMKPRPGSYTNGQMHPRPGSSANGEVHISASRSSQANSRLSSQKPASSTRPDSASLNPRKQLGSNDGVGPGRPAGPARVVEKKASLSALEKKASFSGTKNSLHSAQRPSSSKTSSSDPRQRTEQRKVSHEPTRSQMIPKQSVASSKHQISKPLKSAPPRAVMDDRRPKKRPMSEDDVALSMIRKMFNTDRYTGRGYDDDESDMEANFEEIMREEKRSARIAQKEDEEQLRLIEEEERRERMRKAAKKRKLSHH